jgi:hypothetical protein
MNEDQRLKLREIAKKLGITVEELLKMGEPSYIIEAYEQNKFQILNEG